MTLITKTTLPKALLASLFGIGLLGAAHAETAAFDVVDTDGDGMLTMDEVKTMLPDLTEDQIALADADGNGMLDPTEYQVLVGG